MADELVYKRDRLYRVILTGAEEPLMVEAADVNVDRSGALVFVERYTHYGSWFSPGARFDRDIRILASGNWLDCRRIDRG